MDCVGISSVSCWLVLLFHQFYVGVCDTDCLIDDAKGPYDPDNVYQCPAQTKCCIEAAKPSCCKNKDSEAEILDQVLLWGCIIGAAVAVALLICCCRRDSTCCERDKTCKYYVTCGCCRGSNRPDDVGYQKFAPPSPTQSLKSTKTVTSFVSSSVSGVDTLNT